MVKTSLENLLLSTGQTDWLVIAGCRRQLLLQDLRVVEIVLSPVLKPLEVMAKRVYFHTDATTLLW